MISSRSGDMHLANRTRPCDRRLLRRYAQFQPEVLEPRQLLSTTDLAGLVAAPALSASISPDASRTPAPTPYGPSQIRNAYGVNQIPAPTTPAGTVATDGTGETIAIVDAYADPNIQTDLTTFDSKEGVTGNGTLTVLNESGQTSPLPGTDPTGGWELEESLDVEWAHAIAPGADILLVEAQSPSNQDLLKAVGVANAYNTASYNMNTMTYGPVGWQQLMYPVVAVSMSWGESEFSGETSYDASTFSTPGVVYVAASGDSGVVEWPSSSPNVVAVGGTSLTVTNGAYSNETAWSGSGGGVKPVREIAHLPVQRVRQIRVRPDHSRRGVRRQSLDRSLRGVWRDDVRGGRHQRRHAAVGRHLRAGRPGAGRDQRQLLDAGFSQ